MFQSQQVLLKPSRALPLVGFPSPRKAIRRQDHVVKEEEHALDAVPSRGRELISPNGRENPHLITLSHLFLREIIGVIWPQIRAMDVVLRAHRIQGIFPTGHFCNIFGASAGHPAQGFIFIEECLVRSLDRHSVSILCRIIIINLRLLYETLRPCIVWIILINYRNSVVAYYSRIVLPRSFFDPKISFNCRLS